MARIINGKFQPKSHRKRPGIYAKTKQSFNKGADNYVKRNVGQGR